MQFFFSHSARNRIQIFVLALTLLVSGVYLSGCVLLVGAAAGAGGITWVKGKLTKELTSKMDNVYNATLKGLKKLELPVLVDRKDKLTAKIESKFADGTNVWIDIESLTSRTTRIKIRVGVLGDQERSNEILNAIEQGL